MTPLQCVRLLLSSTISPNLLKFMSIESVIPPNHFILCHPLLPPSIFPSIRVFSSSDSEESVLHIRWPKYLSFSFNNSPSKEHSGLISFRMDVLDLLPVQATQKSSLAPQFESFVIGIGRSIRLLLFLKRSGSTPRCLLMDE